MRSWRAKNREKHNAAVRAWRNKNRERRLSVERAYHTRPDVARKIFDARISKLYGITADIFDSMLSEQGGVCAICFKENKDGKRLVIDHCHLSGAVRGLLCDTCNLSLGHFEDSPERFISAAQYLKKAGK